MSKSGNHFEGGVLSDNSGHAQLGPFTTSATQTATAVAKENGQLQQENGQLREQLTALKEEVRQRMKADTTSMSKQLEANKEQKEHISRILQRATDAETSSAKLRLQMKYASGIIVQFGQFAARRFAHPNFETAKAAYEEQTRIGLHSCGALLSGQLTDTCAFLKTKLLAARHTAVRQSAAPQSTVRQSAAFPTTSSALSRGQFDSTMRTQAAAAAMGSTTTAASRVPQRRTHSCSTALCLADYGTGMRMPVSAVLGSGQTAGGSLLSGTQQAFRGVAPNQPVASRTMASASVSQTDTSTLPPVSDILSALTAADSGGMSARSTQLFAPQIATGHQIDDAIRDRRQPLQSAIPQTLQRMRQPLRSSGEAHLERQSGSKRRMSAMQATTVSDSSQMAGSLPLPPLVSDSFGGMSTDAVRDTQSSMTAYAIRGTRQPLDSTTASVGSSQMDAISGTTVPQFMTYASSSQMPAGTGMTAASSLPVPATTGTLLTSFGVPTTASQRTRNTGTSTSRTYAVSMRRQMTRTDTETRMDGGIQGNGGMLFVGDYAYYRHCRVKIMQIVDGYCNVRFGDGSMRNVRGSKLQSTGSRNRPLSSTFS